MKQCPVEITNNIMSGKWKPLLILKLGNKKYNFNELQKSLGNVTPRFLSLALKDLERDKIVKRLVLPNTTPIKVEYSLTKLGETLEPIVRDMYEWGEAYSKEVIESEGKGK